MSFVNPQFFWLLCLLPFIGVWQFYQRRKIAVTYSSLKLFENSVKTWRQYLLFVPPLCLHLALSSLIIALSQPQVEVARQRQDRQGIAIQVLIDVSSSMDISMDYGDEKLSRMEIAKKVVEEFISGDGKELTGRPDDLIGVITFARYADTICPMTLGQDALVYMVREITINNRPNEDGTAYGDATALAAAYLEDKEKDDDDDAIKSKIVILLTDGENNCGEHEPKKAMVLAKEWGIKIYTISIQSEPFIEKTKTTEGEFLMPEDPSASDQLLEQMALETGGIFRKAYDFDSLQAVYKEINSLEKTKMKAVNYTDYDPYFDYFVMLTMLFLLIKYVLSATILRVAP